MESQIINIQKLTLLGLSGAAISVITELANEIYGISNFDIVKNVAKKPDEKEYIRKDFEINEYGSEQYSFNTTELNVFFGALDSPVKFILFQFFFKKFGVDKSHYLSLIHPQSYFSKSSKYKPGFLLEPLSIVSSFCKIGFGVSIKRNSSAGHHVELGDFVTVNPGVNISGNVIIGEGTIMGTGSSVVNNIQIGKQSLIGAGSVVTKDIPDSVIAYGNPCKVIQSNDRWENVFKIVNKI